MTRDELEKALARRFGRELTAQEKEIVALAESDPDRLLHTSYWEEEKQRYPWLRRLLAAGAIAAAVEALPAGARGRLAPPIPAGAQTIEETVIGLAENWAKEYSFDLIKGITETTRDAVASALDEYRVGLIDYDQFVARLAPKFGPGRAATIARTEAARAGNAGALETGRYLESQGYQPHYIYMYSQSSAPCPSDPLCAVLNGREVFPGTPEWPPRHYNCQCQVNTTFDVPSKTYITPEQLDEKLAAIQPPQGPPGPAGPPGPPGEPGKPAEAKVVERVVETVKVVEQPVEWPEMGPKDVLVGGEIRPLTLDDLPPLPRPLVPARRGGGLVPHTHTKFGNDSDYVEISTDGELSLNGDATVWDDIRVPVTSTRVAGVSDPVFAAIRKNTGGTSLGVYAYKFVPTAGQNSLHFAMQVPHNYKLGSSIEAHVHWTSGSDTTATDTAIWGLEYSFADLGEAFPVTSTLTTTDNPTAVEFEHQLADLGTFPGSSNVSAILLGRVYYSTTSTLGVAWLTEVDFHYEIDSLGSRSELSK